MKAVEKWKSGAIYECTRTEAAIELIASLRCGLKECSICDRRIAHEDNAYWEFWRQQYIDALAAAIMELKKQIPEDSWVLMLSERKFMDFR